MADQDGPTAAGAPRSTTPRAASAHLPRARHEHLLRQVELHGSVRSARAAAELGVSEVTVRCDIVELERAGLLARVHGGAIALASAGAPQAARLLVGVVVPGTTVHFPDVVRGMESISHAQHARLVLGVSHYRPDVEEKQVARLLALGVDGLLLAPTARGRGEEEIASWITSIPVPTLLLERRFGSMALRGFDSVRTDHAHGAALAVDHFAALGHRRVALAVYDRTPTAPSVRDGHREASRRHALAAAPDVRLPKGEEDPEALEEALHALLDECAATGTTSVLVHTDDHATRLVEAALDRGLDVPRDLAVVAYDDEVAGFAPVPLTAVTPPRRALGREALRTLVERVGETGPRGPARHVELLPTLTVRRSCGPPTPASPR
ncbi:LacI family DNA-binding transcriptional regulator [Kineococcus esterisolvens]|uniref:LacI family DNA-binding transcriptional regulator n=1 Tax=unclassified Kineococcus TaxID=2621656 RepID=UPI003D7D054B